jgi:hypothetical protein
MRPLFQAGRSARIAGKFGVSMTDPPIRHALPIRQPDVDQASISQDAVLFLMAAMSPQFRMLRRACMSIIKSLRFLCACKWKSEKQRHRQLLRLRPSVFDVDQTRSLFNLTRNLDTAFSAIKLAGARIPFIRPYRNPLSIHLGHVEQVFPDTSAPRIA